MSQLLQEMKTKKQQQANKKRVFLLDFLRGFSVVSMVAFHAMYDLVFLFGASAPWFTGWQGSLWQKSIAWTFMLVSGATLHYSSKPIKRGITIFACGMLVTVITFLFMPSEKIVFGVLHCLGLCMVLWGLSKKKVANIPPLLGVIVALLLFFLTRGVPNGYIGINDVLAFQLPQALYETKFLFFLGFPRADFWSSDYFPLIPWFFLYGSGYFLWSLVKTGVKAEQRRPNLLEWTGQHSLLVYMVHQPLVYGVLWVLFWSLSLK